MNNEIKNPKTEVKAGIGLNDKDYIGSLLSCLKEMVKNYTVALTEASNEQLYQEYKDMFLEYLQLQRDVYELMFKKGWYVLEKADNNKINSKYQTLMDEFKNLSN